MTDVLREPVAQTYAKTRRYEVKAGTKYASVVVRVKDNERVRAELAARRLALMKFIEEFGPVEWDSAVIVFTHTTLDVVCELRVDR